MALWLFRRKSRRKRSRRGSDSGGETQRPVARSQTAPDTTTSTTTPTRQHNMKKQHGDPKKLQRRPRTYSFESGRRDSLQVSKKKRGHGSVPPVPPLPPGAGAIPATTTTIYANPTDDEKNREDENALGEDNFERIPTLHANKRDGQHLRPRKSSKRRKNSHDREREAELKAMSNFVPVRPATDEWTAGRPMKRDTRKVRTGLGLGFGTSGRNTWDKEQQSSDISLPIPESIHSSMSSDSEHISYKVSTFDALAPKPTLRYSSNGRWGPPSAGSMAHRLPSQTRRLSEKEPFPEATLRAHKRIHELADDLSAGDLRELMERDNRRRERKRQKDQEKIERRLARRAEKQRLATDGGSPNLERGVVGREVGLGIDPTSAVVTSSRRRPSDASPTQEGKQPEGTTDNQEEKMPQPQPLDAFHRTSSMAVDLTDLPTPVKESEEPVPSPVKSPAKSPKRRSFLRPKKSRSKSPPPVPQQKAETSETPRKGSESGSSRVPMSWTSFFRRSNKAKRGSGPSSFSNTSRDSMGTQTQPTVPSAPPVTYVASRKMSSGVPRRTLSRFREDLPDFLSTPPDSRAQSPAAEPLPAAIAEQPSPPPAAVAGPGSSAQEQGYGTPTSEHHSYEANEMRQTPTSWAAQNGPSPEPQHSISMASIDSEGSWLSGRIGNRRRSSTMQQTLDSRSHSRLSEQHQAGESRETVGSLGQDHPEDDATDVADDEYFNRYARHSAGGGSAWAKNRKSTGEARPSSDDEDGARLGAINARLPTVVQEGAAERMKSREGLLRTGDEDDLEADLDSPISPLSVDSKEVEASLQRATSINLGRSHARHISAGSAKLLELSPRNSVDTKRRSFDPRA